jgi:hypothetical protein
VAGEGNVKLFPRPSVRVPWATLVPGEERVSVDTSAQRVRGHKEFDWVLTPRVAGELDLPPVQYSFFNPETRHYEVTSTSPEHLRVSAGTLASADTAPTLHLLAIRARYRGVPRAPLHEHPIFWALLVLAPLPAITLSRRRGAAARPPVRLTPERTLSNAVRAERPDPCAVRRAFTHALADRAGLDAESFTRVGGLSRALRRRGVSTKVALDAEGFLRDLDEAAFTADGGISRDSAMRAVALYAAVDAEALARSDLRSRALLLSALIVMGAGAVHAATMNDARARFDAGVAAYQHHVIPVAVASFRSAVQLQPAAPDAWANLGTADWAAGDTAHAVAAWQRALRREPLALDMRERAQYVHALPASAAGYVPPIAPWWVFDLAAVLWLGACGWATIRLLRKKHVLYRPLAVAGVAALVLVVSGLALRERLSGRGLAVVRATQPVSVVPAFGGGTGPTAIIGEVVHVRGEQGAWSRVVLDDGRDGWIATSALVSLDDREGSAAAN